MKSKNNKLKVGDLVIDSAGIIGVIKEIENSHNVFVKYRKSKGQNGGSGIYCQVKKCPSYDPLKLYQRKS